MKNFLTFAVSVTMIIVLSSCARYKVINQEKYKKVTEIEMDRMPIYTKQYNNGYFVLSHFEDDNNASKAFLGVLYDDDFKKLDSFFIPKPEFDNIASFVMKNDILTFVNRTNMTDQMDIGLFGNSDKLPIKFNGFNYDMKTRKVIKSDSLYNLYFYEREDVAGEINAIVRFSPDSTRFLIISKTFDLNDSALFIGKTYNSDLNMTSEFEFKINYPEDEGNHTLDIVLDNSGNSYIVSAFRGEDEKDNYVQIDAIGLNGAKIEKKIYFKNEIREKGEETFIDAHASVKVKNDNVLAIAIAHSLKRVKIIGFSYIETDVFNDKSIIKKSNVFGEDRIEQLVDDDSFFNYKIADCLYSPNGNILLNLCCEVAITKKDKLNYGQKAWENKSSSTENWVYKHLLLYYDKDFNPKWQTLIDGSPIRMEIMTKGDGIYDFGSHKSWYDYRHNTPGFKYKGFGWDWRYNGFLDVYFMNNNIYTYSMTSFNDRGLSSLKINESDGRISDKKMFVSTFDFISFDLNNNFIIRNPDSFLVYCLDGFYFDFR